MVSCAKDEKQQAEEMLQKAQNCYDMQNFNSAVAYIDTINTKFEKQVNVRKRAKIIDLNIKILKQRQNLTIADSLFTIKQNEFNSQLSEFDFEKDEKYQTEGFYTAKGQETARIAFRNMLKPYVAENGELQIHSLCVGNTGHSQVKLSADGEEISGEIINNGSPFNYTYSDGETRHQTLVITQKADSIADFINEHQSQNIKVYLINGTKTLTSYTLSPKDKSFIIKTASLSSRLKDVMKYKHQREVAERKIAVFQNSLSDYEAEIKIEKEQQQQQNNK